MLGGVGVGWGKGGRREEKGLLPDGTPASFLLLSLSGIMGSNVAA